MDRLLLLHGDLLFALVAVLIGAAISAVISRSIRRASRRDTLRIREAMIAGGDAWVAGARVTLRGRLRVDSAAAARFADGAPCGATTLVGDPSRADAGGLDREGLGARAERLALEVRGPDGATLRVPLLGPIDVVVGSSEHRSSRRLGGLGRLRRRLADVHPLDADARSLEYVVERSLVDGDPAAITGVLGRGPDGGWALGGPGGAGPFRRDDAVPSGEALVAALEGATRRVTSELRPRLVASLLAAGALLLATHGLASAWGLRIRTFEPKRVEAVTPTLLREARISALSPLDRGDALFTVARAVEYQAGADASTFAEAMELYEASGGCRLAVAAAASAHPREAAARAERCRGGRGEAIALYQLGRFREAAASLAARPTGDPSFDGEAGWRVEALLLGGDVDGAAAALRPHGFGAPISTLADALDGGGGAQRRLDRLRASPTATQRDPLVLLELADRLDVDERFALLDALDAGDLLDDRALVLWWLLRAEIRPEAAWKPPAPPEGRPFDTLAPPTPAPPFLSSAPFAHLETVQPLPDLPWGLVFSVARDLERRSVASGEARRTRARVSHAAGVFELLAGEYVEAERWFDVTAEECERLDRTGDIRSICSDLREERVIVALFAGDLGRARERLVRDWTPANRLGRVIELAGGEGRGGDAAIASFLGKKAFGDDGDWITARLREERRLEHPALRLFATPTLEGRDELVRYLLWEAPPGACIPSVGDTLLPETAARAASLSALGEHEAAEALRAQARRIRARLQEREGAAALYLARVRRASTTRPWTRAATSDRPPSVGLKGHV